MDACNSPWAMTLMLRMLVGLSMSPRIWSVKIGGLHVVPQRETRLLTYGEVAASSISWVRAMVRTQNTHTMATVFSGEATSAKVVGSERQSLMTVGDKSREWSRLRRKFCTALIDLGQPPGSTREPPKNITESG